MTDILFPFARVVSKRESGVLNSHHLIVDIFEDYRERENAEGLIRFYKKIRGWILSVQILYKQKRTPERVPISRFLTWLRQSTHTVPDTTIQHPTRPYLAGHCHKEVLGYLGSKPSTVSHYTYRDNNVKKLLTGGVPVVTSSLYSH